MKKLLFSTILLLCVQILNAQSPTLAWAYQTSSTYSVEGISVAVDAQGFIYTTGNFKIQTDFDPGPGVVNLDVVQLGYSDIYITKMTPSGQLVWARKVGGYYDDVSSAIFLDKLGNILITGNFSGTSDFNPGTAVNNLVTSSSNNPDVFVLKLDTAGNYIWAKSYSGTSATDVGLSITSDNLGNVYVGGAFGGTVDFNPSPTVTNNITGSGGSDIFISKLNANGDYVWAYKIAGSGNDNLYSLHIDDEDKLLLTGSFTGTVDFNVSTAAANNLVSGGTFNPFIAKFDLNATYIWARVISLFDNGYGNSITTDSANNVYVAGGFTGTGDFNPGTPTLYKTSAGANDVFILKLDKNGIYANMKQFGGTMNDNPNTIVADIAGNVFLTGNFSGVVDFDPSAAVFSLTSASSDMFLTKLDASMNFGFAYAISSTSVDLGKYLALDPNGAVVVIGRFQGTADFDPGPAVYPLSTLQPGTYGAFVQKILTPIATVPTNFNVQVKAAFQGFYAGGGQMSPVLLNQGVGNSSTECDTVTVQFREPTPPNNVLFEYKGIMNTNGEINVVLPAPLNNQLAFIVVQNRNSIAIWSALPVPLSNNLLYNFTTNPASTYGDNVTLIESSPIIWAAFSGDINADGVIDGLDFNDWESDSNNFGAGYIPTDVNGDGVSDGLDFVLIETNTNNFVGVVTP